MAKTLSLFLDDKEIRVLDRLARAERRSQSAILREVIRRYARFAEGQNLEHHPLFRRFSDAELANFLREDGRVPHQEN